MGAEFFQKVFLLEVIIWFLSFVNMVYHIDWFAYIEESLQTWDKPDLIMVYDLFNVLLNSFR